MVTIVFALAVANLGLGIALAVALDQLVVPSILYYRSRLQSVAADGPSPPVEREDGQQLPPVDDGQNNLMAARSGAKSEIEELMWTTKIETIACRERLVALDRTASGPPTSQTTSTELKDILESFHELLEGWIAEASAEREHSGPLAELLLDQAVQLRSCVEELSDAAPHDVARELATSLAAVTDLRDQVDALLCQLLTAEERLHTVPDCCRTFGERDTLTPFGLAALYDAWWSDDPHRVRLVSLVMLDLDRFTTFTEQIGIAQGDRVLACLGDLLHDLVRQDRGFDRVARITGQRFVMFLGDTSSKNAAKAADRIRQSIGATGFKLQGETYELSASVAVIEVDKSETPSEFMPRLEATLSHCKQAGGNCGYVDSGNGPAPIRLPKMESMPPRVIELEEQFTQ